MRGNSPGAGRGWMLPRVDAEARVRRLLLRDAGARVNRMRREDKFSTGCAQELQKRVVGGFEFIAECGGAARSSVE